MPSFIVWIVDSFKVIPDVIWSGVIASTLTLGGVLLSNRSNTNRLKLQLQHEASQNSEERKAVLRRNVYLQAAEEAVKASCYLGSLPQTDLSKVNLAAGLQSFYMASTKLQLIAEQKTSLLVQDLVAAYTELLFRLVVAVSPIQQLRVQIEICSGTQLKANKEIDRVLASMTQLNEAGKADQVVFEALTKSYEFNRSLCDDAATELEGLFQDMNRRQLEFNQKLMSEMMMIGSLQQQLFVLLREELGIESDSDAYMQHMKTQEERMKQALNQFMDAIKSTDSD